MPRPAIRCLVRAPGAAWFTTLLLGWRRLRLHGRVNLCAWLSRRAVSARARWPGDFNGDGAVNLNDWTEFNAAFNDPAAAPWTCDIDADGGVTDDDYDLFGSLWDETSDPAYHHDEVRLGSSARAPRRP